MNISQSITTIFYSKITTKEFTPGRLHNHKFIYGRGFSSQVAIATAVANCPSPCNSFVWLGSDMSVESGFHHAARHALDTSVEREFLLVCVVLNGTMFLVRITTSVCSKRVTI